MACHLFSTKPLPETMLIYCQLDLEQHTSVKSFLNIFIEENALEYVVCEMAFILEQGMDELSHPLFYDGCNYLSML